LHEWCREQSQKNGESGVSSAIVIGPGNSPETVGLLVPDAFAETLGSEIRFTH
jgi:hypothetical protein